MQPNPDNNWSLQSDPNDYSNVEDWEWTKCKSGETSNQDSITTFIDPTVTVSKPCLAKYRTDTVKLC